MLHKKTKIVCTLGPASQDFGMIEKMVHAGMNVARLNFSHGSYESFSRIIENIRKVEKKVGTPIAIMQDLQGPKIRVGEMPAEGINIKKGQTIILTTTKIVGHLANSASHTAAIIPCQYQELPKDVKKNDQILIDDGLIEVTVIKVQKNEIFCRVANGGIVKSHKGINVPTASIKANPITDKDKADLKFGLAHNVDYVALSFVKSAENIKELRELIRLQKGRAKIIAKIERHEAVENLESIIFETDGVMVARGDLGSEIPAETVPLIQKRIIKLANLHGKPVITATQILQSMVDNPRPTRAEMSDAANAVFDHSDALMLSNESAVGKYPLQATATLSKVAASVEQYLKRHKEFLPNLLFHENLPVSYATCLNAAKLAVDINADLIIAITNSGFTAQHLAKHRIYIPIIALTEDPKVQRQLALVWGIKKTYIQPISKEIDVKMIRQFLKKNNLAKANDKIVIVSNASKDEKQISTIKF
ncbi:MAG: pyruvate kinase [Candidatus Gracilibacteria bacterium]|jgi:pyruvate kinase